MAIETTKAAYTDLGNKMMDAALGVPVFGPILRQPIPDDPDTVTLLHWLFAARGDIPLPTVVLAYQATAADNALVIPAGAGGGTVQRVWQVYPADTSLLYDNPNAPAIGGGSVVLTADDWVTEDNRTVITHPEITDGAWKIVYSYAVDGEVVYRGDGYEAYPTWTRIPDGYAACAPDTFRWFDITAERAIALDTRPGKAAAWTKLRDALRRTAVRGQDITDLRAVLEPKPGMGVFALDGMFCWSDHPGALTPPAGTSSGPGYNFWSRPAGSGDILGVVPAVTGPTAEVQLGRGVEDSWRVATAYQEADQYLYIEIGAALEADGTLPTGTAVVFVSSTREYATNTRWAAEIDLDGGALIEEIDGVELRGHLIPRTDLLRLDNASALPAGQGLLNFGVQLKLDGRYHVRMRHLRLLSGEDAEWVEENLEEALRGAPMPYFPGAMPFALNADTTTGNLVGYNGNPFHGYQMPDLWLALEDEAELIHAGLTAADLPVPNGAGEITYPITANNTNAVPKPINILLAEQQTLFLRDAQVKYEDDRGVLGPFAHTFVLNTAARLNIGSPAPHTWVYTGDDPNTRWVGYQVRPVESLCRMLYLIQDRTDALDLRVLADSIVENWFNWLAVAWPDLTGDPYTGMPTDFPGDADPSTNYEEPHAAAIVLRALLWLRMAGDDDADRAALAVRCWQYLESMFNPTGRMGGTWCTDVDKLLWYGFWHGEIIETLALIVGDAHDALPAGIARMDALERLTASYNWLSEWGIREVS